MIGLSQSTLCLLIISTLVTQNVHSMKPGLAQYFEQTPGHNLTVPEGQPLTLPCIVRNLQGTCVWNFNGRAIWTNSPRNGDCSFTLKEVSLEKHDGVWQCQVTPPLDGEPLVSKAVTLTVLVSPEKPQIERSSKYASLMAITANSSDTITCNVFKGNPPPKIEWFLNDRNITDQAISRILPVESSGRKDIRTVSELRAKFSQEHNNQTLVCRAHHPTGSFSDSVTLRVLYLPIVNVPRTVYSVQEGSPVRVECKVDANPAPNVFWQKRDGDAISSSEANVLFIPEVKRDMNGAVFECHASNTKGSAKPVPVRIDVHYMPQSVNYSTEQSVRIGHSTKLYCFFDGNPKPDIQWYQIDPRTGIHHQIEMPSGDNHVLPIFNATYNHEGEYYCKAINMIGGQTHVVSSPRMLVDVHGLPAFSHPEPLVVEGPRGQTSQLVMEFCSDPPPIKVFWHYGSIQLEVKNVEYSPDTLKSGNRSALRHRILPFTMIQAKHERAPYYKCYKAELEIRDTDPSDEREYTLVAQNEYGTSSRILRLRVVSPFSFGLVLATALVVIFAAILLTFLIITVLKCRRSKKNCVVDEEAKEDAQVLSQSITNESMKTKPLEKVPSEKHELVYANLDFMSNESILNPPPPTKPKPAMQARPLMRNNITNSSEYAKLSFPTKADL
ncbi:irregular chiasm C-roughest protein isoform X2 [Brevipalpus obovatus]|uniref:irregular chiasm C-roughest protein isoform X2 n=2 Tax=Brevipalpus obovatus TaxID=246614 RepID=UPI003D9E70BA